MNEFMAFLTSSPWAFLVPGYLFTILVETAVLLVGLSPEHPVKRRLAAGAWLTACTYPVVVLVLPGIQFLPDGYEPTHHRLAYLAVAETFAPVAECLLFWAAFGPLKHPWRDLTAITLANFASFGIGELLLWYLQA
jgi:hypothetical protein